MISSPYGPQPLPREASPINASRITHTDIVETPFTPTQAKVPPFNPATTLKKVQFALIATVVMGIAIMVGYFLGLVFS